MKTRQFIIGLMFFLLSVAAWSFNLAPQPVPFAIPHVNFSSEGKTFPLERYKGKKVMLWLFSTWCHTCVAGVKAMAKNQAVWNDKGLIILTLRNYNNGGYPGVIMPAFIKNFSPQVKEYKNWVAGESSEQMYNILNAKIFPDIYFLIDEKGIVQTVNTAPNTTMNKILKFIDKKSK